MFVAHTPDNELARRLQAIEDQYSKLTGRGKMKIVEGRGVTILDTLAKNSP